MARQAEVTFLAINQSRTTKEQAMLRRGLHGAYELAAPDASANGFSNEKRVSRSFDALLRPHDRDPLFHSEKGDQSVLDQIESLTLRGGLWTARTTDNPFNINHLLPPTM
jgi:hypothetical protein